MPLVSCVAARDSMATATTHQEKGTITLESNPSRGTVLPAQHGKGNKVVQESNKLGRK